MEYGKRRSELVRRDSAGEIGGRSPFKGGSVERHRIPVTPAQMRTLPIVTSYTNEPTAWAAVLESDGNAFAAVFDLHRDRVYHHALRMTTSVHDAEDVAAAAFFELWRRRRSVHLVNDSVLPWLLVTTTNLARNLTRGLRRYRALLATLPRVYVTRWEP